MLESAWRDVARLLSRSADEALPPNRVVRRQVQQLAAIAEKRATQAEAIRMAPSFRPSTESETDTIVGGELLAKLAAVLKS